MESTVVEVQVVSKKEGFQWGTPGNAKETEIEVAVPYDTSSVFFKQSGGTNMVLKTINQAAADMFVIGGKVKVEFTPIGEAKAEEKV